MIESSPITVGDLIKIGTVLVAFIGIMIRVLMAFKKYSDAVDQKIAEYEESHDKKHARIYERLDAVKKAGEEKFVSKEIFQMMHDNYLRGISEFKRELDEVKRDVKTLLSRGNGGNHD